MECKCICSLYQAVCLHLIDRFFFSCLLRFNTLTSLETSSNDRDHMIIDCSGLVMADGKSHILGNVMCKLVRLPTF